MWELTYTDVMGLQFHSQPVFRKYFSAVQNFRGIQDHGSAHHIRYSKAGEPTECQEVSEN